jgi:hypothetical protein
MELTIVIIIMLIIALVLIIIFNNGGSDFKNKFISKQTYELYNKSKKAFSKGSSYTNFRKYVKNTDPVEFMELYQLYMQGKLSPESIQSLQSN